MKKKEDFTSVVVVDERKEYQQVPIFHYHLFTKLEDNSKFLFFIITFSLSLLSIIIAMEFPPASKSKTIRVLDLTHETGFKLQDTGKLPHREWEDAHLDTFKKAKIPTLDNASAIVLFKYWLFGIMTGSSKFIAEATVVLSGQLRDPANHKTPVIDLNDGSFDQNQTHLEDIATKASTELLEGEKMYSNPTEDIALDNPLSKLIFSKTVDLPNIQKFDEFFSELKSTDEDTVVALASFLAFCTLRIITATEETIIRKIKEDYITRFNMFYSTSITRDGITIVSESSLKQIKATCGAGTPLLQAILVPILKMHCKHCSGISLLPETIRSILQFGLLMSTEYTGLYMAQIFVKVINQLGGNEVELLRKEYLFLSFHGQMGRALFIQKPLLRGGSYRLDFPSDLRFPRCEIPFKSQRAYPLGFPRCEIPFLTF